jgi:hypothetical protein
LAPSADHAKELSRQVREATEATSIGEKSAWTTLIESILWNSSARIELNDGNDAKQTEKFMTKGNVTE